MRVAPAALARALSALLALVSVAPRPSHAARGGDTFGYRWYDSTEPECDYDGLTIDADETRVSLADEEVVGPIPIGFPFTHYGVTYTDIWISSNGWMSFSPPPGPAPGPMTIPSTATPNATLAPLWSELGAGFARYRYIPELGFFYLRWQSPIVGTAALAVHEMRLYVDGQIRFVYGNAFSFIPVADRARFTIGIESATGGRGLNVWNRGLPGSGYAFRGDRAICFDPPPNLDCGTATIGCDAAVSGDTAAAPSRVAGYTCGVDLLDGGERAYALTLDNLTEVSARLGGIGGRDVRVTLLDGCDERACLESGGPAIGPRLLGPGSYRLVVDQAAAQAGRFDLTTTCVARGFDLPCGGGAAGAVGPGTSLFDEYACARDSLYPGAEVFYDVSLATAGNLRLALDGTCDLEAFLFRADAVAPGACLAHGLGGVTYYDAAPGDYVIVVEGRSGAACSFDAELECRVQTRCGSPAAVLGCGDVVSGSTVGAVRRVDDYACRPGEAQGGGEALYRIDADPDRSVGVRLERATSAELALFLLDGCNEGRCLDDAGAGADGGAGAPGASAVACDAWSDGEPLFVLVDSPTGGEGEFDLAVVCGAAQPDADWRRCEAPFDPIDGTTRAADAWRFATPLPTPLEPDPVPRGSYCGTGCDFALYLPVGCGGDLHVVLDDAESAAGVELTEVTTGRRALLEATNHGGKDGSSPWSFRGLSASWLSTPCVSPVPPDPPDLGKDDPRFNDAAVDVTLDPSESPCGLWRVDLRSVGGVDWGLTANCTGDARGDLTLYDNVCDATAAYAPRAELHARDLVTDGSCPIARLSFYLENLGCATVDAAYRLDGGPGPGSVVDGAALALAPGETRLVTELVNVSAPSGRVRIALDPDDALVECSEAGDGCGALAGAHDLEIAACGDGCTVELPPSGVIGNAVRAARAGADAALGWDAAPPLAVAGATHFHVYRVDRKTGGAWDNLPLPDLLTATAFTDPDPPGPLALYQVRFASDCEDISGGDLP